MSTLLALALIEVSRYLRYHGHGPDGVGTRLCDACLKTGRWPKIVPFPDQRLTAKEPALK
jgi:hypothetical protein